MINRYSVLIFLIITNVVYTSFIYTQGPSIPPEKDTTIVNAGLNVWQKYNCSACHQLFGLGGYMGPDLTHVVSRKGPLYVQAILTAGTSRMPNFDLEESEIDSMVQFLKQNTQLDAYPDNTRSFDWLGVESDGK